MKKTCKHCGTEFEAKTSKAEYCSDAHRYAAWAKRKKTLGNTPSPANQTPPSPTAMQEPIHIEKPSGMEFHTQYVFDLQKKEIDRWETAYKEYLKKYETEKEKREAVEKEFEKFKNESSLEKIRESKPSGLAGFAESEFGKQMMPFIGPAIGSLANALVSKAIPQSGQVADDPMIQVVAELPDDVQHGLRDLNRQIIEIKDPAKIAAILSRIRNLLRKDIAVEQQPPVSMNGTFGMDM